MKCPSCLREIVNPIDLEYTATFGLCLSCDHVLLDQYDDVCDSDPEDDIQGYSNDDISMEDVCVDSYGV
jgi:hypothetical protein